MGQKITPFLWFDSEAEEAAQLYTSVFPNSRIVGVSRYGEAGPGTAGSVMTVELRARREAVRRAERRARVHASPKPCRSRSTARRRRRSTTTGASSARAASTARAAGSRTASALSWQVVPSALPRLLVRLRS